MGIWVILVLSKRGREAAELVAFPVHARPSLLVSHPHYLHLLLLGRLCRPPSTLPALLLQGPNRPPSPGGGSQFRYCVEQATDVPSCRITRLRRYPLWPQFAWGHGANPAPCCTGCFPNPSFSPSVLVGSFSPRCPPRNKAPKKFYTSVMKFCHFSVSVAIFAFSFPRGAQPAAARKHWGGPSDAHHSGSPRGAATGPKPHFHHATES